MSSSGFVIVETEYGPVKGLRKSSILGMDFINFQGIPYMKAPTGKLRFRDAQPPEKWSEPIEPEEVGYPDMDFLKNELVGHENAGVINVYTKHVEPAKKYPVMVWVICTDNIKVVFHRNHDSTYFNLDSWRWIPIWFVKN